MDIERFRLPITDARGHWLPDNAELDVVRIDGETFPGGAAPMCEGCAEHPTMELGDDAARPAAPCALPDGITTEITLDVPSGKLLVTDDLRPIYSVDDAGFADYCSALGQAQMTQAMAAIGCAYGAVSNTSPGLYRTGADTYVVARPSLDEDDEPDPALPDSACVANVCTDLWAYSMADFKDWKSRGGDPDSLRWTSTIVDVTPGTYRFTHHFSERGFEWDTADTVTFAHIQRIA